ncbi:YczE/YyaS/YitT family protein [Bacillus piscicola]|uniref:YczE/YyaS/YitT family protein n=1 Tax=Bacillus piscicola TaxID=1632684 RepID=UPI001F08FF3A|nr:YitT family protein [Bacillus piscicola]
MTKTLRKRNYLFLRWFIFTLGLIIMAFGIALMIRAELGSAPWDVLHVGLQHQFGLTVGTWSIGIGILIIGSTALLKREIPQVGSIINMVLVGVFIDVFLLFLSTPEVFIWKLIMLLSGIVVIGYGIGIYIAPNCGAGPRDSLMLVLQEKTGWKLSRVRGLMEIGVLTVGWLLGGPVFIGTLLFCVGIGQVVGITVPQCRRLFQRMIERGGNDENINQRAIRTDDNDGIGEKAR